MESMYIKNPRYIKDNHCIGSIFITRVMNALAEGNKKCVLLILQEIKKLGMTCRAVRKKNTLFISSANRGIDLDSPVKIRPLVIACHPCSQQRRSVVSKGISNLLKINL